MSVATVLRLVDEGKLERVYVRRDPRITARSILTYVEEVVQRNGSLRHPT